MQKKVWGIQKKDIREQAKAGIKATQKFFVSLGLPTTLKQVGIPKDKFQEIEKEAVRTSDLSTRSYGCLSPDDVKAIYESCYE